MDPQNTQIIFNIICALFAGAAGIIAWFAKTHYASIDKKIEALEASEKIIVERIHLISVQITRGELLAPALTDLRTEVKELSRAVHELRIEMERVAHARDFRDSLRDSKTFKD